MNLTNMQMSEEEAKEYAGIATSEGVGNAPKYPYGLEVCLRDDSLKNLGIEKLPEVGTEMLLMAKVIVTSVRSSQQMDGDKESGCDLQITDMSLSEPVAQIDPATVMYGDK
jgi:hypothetical protein